MHPFSKPDGGHDSTQFLDWLKTRTNFGRGEKGRHLVQSELLLTTKSFCLHDMLMLVDVSLPMLSRC